MIDLETVTNSNWREGLGVSAAPHQARFVAGYQPVLLVILAKSAVQAGDMDWWPFLIRDGGHVVGVVAVTDERSRNGSLGIFHLLIDHNHQGHGYGRAALQHLIELGQRDQRCRALRLTVNPDNAPAIALYERAHFTVTGTNDLGEIQMILPL
ncbi:GNAT family N-acetyltransferase [Dermatophilaceae bacterium Sec6.4]